MTPCDDCLELLASSQQPTCADAGPRRAIGFGELRIARFKLDKTAQKTPRISRPVGDKKGTAYL